VTALREHLARELATKVERYGIVIWDDPDAAYSAVVREVVPAGATVSVFDRSWFDLRHHVEPLLAGPQPPCKLGTRSCFPYFQWLTSPSGCLVCCRQGVAAMRWSWAAGK
jgi:hypothetical protein